MIGLKAIFFGPREAIGKMVKRYLFGLCAGVLMSSLGFAQSVNVEDFASNIGDKISANHEGIALSKLSCMENPKPGGAADEKIQSCIYSLGAGRMLIANAETDGALLDFSTQSYSSTELDLASDMVAVIAGEINGDDPVNFADQAQSIVTNAANANDATEVFGAVQFYILNMGDALTITGQVTVQ
jgi:hypothetical protein